MTIATATETDTTHAVYCTGSCTPDAHGCCEIKAVHGEGIDEGDVGRFEVTTTYVPDTGVYIEAHGSLCEVEEIDALIAELTEARNRMEKQEANGL